MRLPIFLLIFVISINFTIFADDFSVTNIGDTIFYQNEPKIIRLLVTNNSKSQKHLYTGPNMIGSLILKVVSEELNIDTIAYPNSFVGSGNVYQKYLNYKDTAEIDFYLEEHYLFENLGDYSISVLNPRGVKEMHTDTMFCPIDTTINIKVIKDDTSVMELKKNNFKEIIRKKSASTEELEYYAHYLFESRRPDQISPRLRQPIKQKRDYWLALMKKYGHDSIEFKKSSSEASSKYLYDLMKTNENFKKISVVKIEKKQKYSFYEKRFDVTLTLFNENEDTSILALGAGNIDNLHFDVTAPSGESLKFFPGSEKIDKFKFNQLIKETNGYYYLKPGEKIEIKIDLRNICEFDEPGLYKIKAENRVEKYSHKWLRLYYFACVQYEFDIVIE